MAIRFFSDGIAFRLRHQRKISQWLQTVAFRENKTSGNLTYVFVSERRILELNRQFLCHNDYTDIITFDDSTEKEISGEMYVCIDTVRKNAERYHTGFENELLRVMVHGILHLCGYNDKTEQEQQSMRAKENDSLLLLSDNSVFPDQWE
ncbi:MAG: rRNA maturation RNase YbeY [Bacteroidales bacterium]|jgi:rRNA maturation RNase YbeY|nr:rRNA maturation RNase YbeY [Bacteroidales bacterium]